MVWWEQRIEAANRAAAVNFSKPIRGGIPSQSKTAAGRDAMTAQAGKRSRGASRI